MEDRQSSFTYIASTFVEREETMHRLAARNCFMITLIFSGCSTYELKVTPFKLPEAYANVPRVADTYVGARAWANDAEVRGLLRRSVG
jgi:hypothetical protein